MITVCKSLAREAQILYITENHASGENADKKGYELDMFALLLLVLFSLPVQAAPEKNLSPLMSNKTKLRINRTEHNPNKPFSYSASFIKPEFRSAKFTKINTKIQKKIDTLKAKQDASAQDKAKLTKLESKLLQSPSWDNGTSLSVLVFAKSAFEQTLEELGTEKGKEVSNPEPAESLRIVDFKYQSLCEAKSVSKLTVPNDENDPLTQYLQKMYLSKRVRKKIDLSLPVLKAEFDSKCFAKEMKNAHLELGHGSGKKVYMPLPKKL